MGLELARKSLASPAKPTLHALAQTMQVDVPPDMGQRAIQKSTMRIIGTPLDYVRAQQAAHPVPEAWAAELRDISPESLQHSWLMLAWLAGTAKQPIDRFVIYEAIPDGLIPAEKRAQLGGTPYWKMPAGMQQGRQQMVSAYQWDMYRKHRVWLRPFWCLQGEHGGTPALYSEMEDAILRAENKDTNPPAPGSLPFAEWNSLAKAQVQMRDRIAKLQEAIRRAKSGTMGVALEAETEAAEKAFRTRFLGWFKETLEPQADFLTHYTKKSEADMVLRPATEQEAIDGETLEESYIETGVMPL